LVGERETEVAEVTMKSGDAVLLKELLTVRRVLSLAVVEDGRPILGMVPFAPEPDLAAVLVHVSGLAPHGRALAAGAPFAVLIHGLDTPEHEPGEIPRVRFSGAAEALTPDAAAYPEARDRYLARFPGSAVTFTLGDFALYRLPFTSGRLVAGFARTVNLKPETLRKLAEDTSL
jgi:putative heme iron utilization protein